MRGKMATCYIYGAMPCGSTEKLEEGDLLIAADGGYAYLQGQKPDLVVGDFDSLGYVPEGEQIIRHPVQKDDTDMLLAVREGLKRGYRKFVLYGGIIRSLIFRCWLFCRGRAVRLFYTERRKKCICSIMKHLSFLPAERGSFLYFPLKKKQGA